MKITDIVEATVPLRSEIRNAVIDFTEMTVSVVAVTARVRRNGSSVTGYGFNSIGRYAQGGLLRERFLPRLRAAPSRSLLDDDGTNFDPNRVWHHLMQNEKPGGHGDRAVAVGAIDMAMWDLAAKIADVPLYELLARKYRAGPPDAQIEVYAAGGYYHTPNNLTMLETEMHGYLESGYTKVKMKVGGASLVQDCKRIEAVLDVVGSGQHLAVDANGRFELEDAMRYSNALAPYGLMWYEEPGDPLDFELHAQVSATYPHALATGENLLSMADTRNLLRYGGLRRSRDVLQMDPGLSYGLTGYLEILRTMSDHGWSWRQAIPHGGHLLAVNAAAGLGLGGSEAYPGIFQPFGGFGDRTPLEGGRLSLSDAPGIGFEEKSDLYKVLQAVSRQ